MNRNKFAFAIMFSLLGFGGIGSAAYVQSTIAQYRNAAPCYQLTGLAGLLQATHFISSGGCTVDLKSGGCREVESSCTIANPPSGGDPNIIRVFVKRPTTVRTAFVPRRPSGRV